MKTASAVIIASVAKTAKNAIAASIAPAATTAIAAKTTNATRTAPAATNKGCIRAESFSARFFRLKGKNMEKHPSHLENIPRLNRISGQIEGIKKMIEEGRYCPEIITQLRAVRSAVKAVESNILHKHLQHCVAQSFGSDEDKEKKIEELKMLFDKFND